MTTVAPQPATLTPGTLLHATDLIGQPMVARVVESGRFWHYGIWVDGYWIQVGEVEWLIGASQVGAGRFWTVGRSPEPGKCDPYRHHYYGLIHGHAKALGLPDDAYRLMLRALTGKASCTEIEARAA